MIDTLLAKGILPDPVIRAGIRKFLAQRLNDEMSSTIVESEAKRLALINELRNSPIAIDTDKANDQHYQVPTEFFLNCLGKNLKYSSCHWDKAQNLDEAEDEMLALTMERAQIQDGQHILELGCGWGSITFALAQRNPNGSVTGVSNSQTQRDFILRKAERLGLFNIEVITCDVNELELDRTFDRVVSVEMFEHVRNYKNLLGKIANWLNDEGKLFVHIFTHRTLAYKFEVKDETDWMSKYFFSGGIMPSEHLFYYFQDDLKVKQHWTMSGVHYAKTARAWLDKMDANKTKIVSIFEQHYGAEEAAKWFHYWRVFYMSCEELWAYRQGNEWTVSHYLWSK